MAMVIVPVAMSLEVAYSVLPSMIYDKRGRGGFSDFICPPALSLFIQKEFGGIGLTKQLHTSGLDLHPGTLSSQKPFEGKKENGNMTWKMREKYPLQGFLFKIPHH